MEFYLIPTVNQQQLNEKMEKDEIIVMQEEAYLFVIYVITQNLVSEYREEMQEQMGLELEFLVQCNPVGFSVENNLLLLFKPQEPDLFVQESQLGTLLKIRMVELGELPFGIDEEKIQSVADEDGYLMFQEESDEEESSSEEQIEIEQQNKDEEESNSDDYWL